MLLGFLLGLVIWCVLPVSAATPTASPSAKVSPTTTKSASPSPTSTATTTTPTVTTDETTQAILDRINKQLTDEQEKQLNQTISTLSQYRRVILGTIERVNDEAVSIKHKKGTLIVPLADKLSVLQDNKPLKKSELTVGSTMLATGALTKPDDINTLVASKLDVFTKSPAPLPITVTLGTLKSITASKVDVTTRLDNSTKTFVINKATKIQGADGSATTVAKLKTDTAVLVVGYTKDNTLFTTTVRSLVE